MRPPRWARCGRAWPVGTRWRQVGIKSGRMSVLCVAVCVSVWRGSGACACKPCQPEWPAACSGEKAGLKAVLAPLRRPCCADLAEVAPDIAGRIARSGGIRTVTQARSAKRLLPAVYAAAPGLPCQPPCPSPGLPCQPPCPLPELHCQAPCPSLGRPCQPPCPYHAGLS
jgi:hypothetical protein